MDLCCCILYLRCYHMDLFSAHYHNSGCSVMHNFLTESLHNSHLNVLTVHYSHHLYMNNCKLMSLKCSHLLPLSFRIHLYIRPETDFHLSRLNYYSHPLSVPPFIFSLTCKTNSNSFLCISCEENITFSFHIL